MRERISLVTGSGLCVCKHTMELYPPAVEGALEHGKQRCLVHLMRKVLWPAVMMWRFGVAW